jgi:FkbM family methyltransferase
MSHLKIVIQIVNFICRNPGNRGKRFAKLAQAFRWQISKRVTGRPRTIRLVNGVRFKAYSDCVVSSAVQYADWPEYHEIQFCRKFLKPGDTVIDVGANVGHFSLLLSDVVGADNIYCFEPTPVSWRRLVENFELNHWPTSRLLQVALGAAEGTVEFPDTESPVTTNSLSSTAKKKTSVQMKTFDSLSNSFLPGSIALLKIDVEGYEEQLFAGAKNFLTQIQPRLIMFESLSGSLRPEIRRTLNDSGYWVFQLDEQGRPDDTQSLNAQNLFAARKG